MAEDAVPRATPELNLSTEEEAATKKFLENVNKWRSARQLEEVNIETFTIFRTFWRLDWMSF